MSITNLNDTTPAAPADGTNVRWQKDATDPVTLIRDASAYVPDATASSRGAVQLAGDLAGTAPAPEVVGMLSIPILSAPADGQGLRYDQAQAGWVPYTPALPAQPYDLVISLVGMPAANMTYLVLVFDRAVNFPADFAGSVGKVLTNPTAQRQFVINKNGAQAGTITVATDGTVSFATSGATQSFVAGDYLTIVTPDPQDASLADVSFTLAGTR